ncbi:MAG: General amino acid permease [Cirrosporium novae-zelandiae]|nr:MAG: General amino acid permease [Cirrosporium novae-zelandiae]
MSLGKQDPSVSTAKVPFPIEDGAQVIIEGGQEEHTLNDQGQLIDDGVRRGLKSRHLQMIAFGGVIGAGTFYSLGYALKYGGPLGALIGFGVVGFDIFITMQSLGEIATLFPTSGSFMEMGGRFVDPAMSFAFTWNYWYMWATFIPVEYNTITLILSYWSESFPSYGFILIFWVFFMTITLLGVVLYGEMEFWLATIKLIFVLAVFFVSILINTGAIGGDYIGFRYWKDPGPFANGINGFGKVFVLAAVYYAGAEMIGITAGESINPRRDVPKAIKQTFWRIVIVYLGTLFFFGQSYLLPPNLKEENLLTTSTGIICPSNSTDLLNATSKTASSPITIALVNAGWSSAGDLVNAVMIICLLSSIPSAIYVGARTLRYMATVGHAPSIFAKTSKSGVPIAATIFTHCFAFLAILNMKATPGQVFTYLCDIGGGAAFIAWGTIGLIHIRFRRGYAVQGYSVDDLPFKALWYPYGAYLCVGMNSFLLIIQGYTTLLTPWQPVAFVCSYLVIPIFLVLFFSYKFVRKTSFVRLEEMDLVTGRREWLAVRSKAGDNDDTDREDGKGRVKRWARDFFVG